LAASAYLNRIEPTLTLKQAQKNPGTACAIPGVRGSVLPRKILHGYR